MSRDAYERIVQEDVEWLLKQPDTLERHHIEQLLLDSPRMYYADNYTDMSRRVSVLSSKIKELAESTLAAARAIEGLTRELQNAEDSYRKQVRSQRDGTAGCAG
jgi:predicted RNase H-like nuclease (RuvC/YqgF family)